MGWWQRPRRKGVTTTAELMDLTVEWGCYAIDNGDDSFESPLEISGLIK